MPVKSTEHQAIRHLHRVRAQWMATRTGRINVIRGMLRELGYAIPKGAASAKRRAGELTETLSEILRPTPRALLAEIRELESRIAEIERALTGYARANADALCLYQVSGIGLLTATALPAAAVDPKLFRNGRHFASWLGMTPREHSSGPRRRLGGISKRGDVYVRMLLTHGARSVLNRARQLAKAGKPLNRLQPLGA